MARAGGAVWTALFAQVSRAGHRAANWMMQGWEPATRPGLHGADPGPEDRPALTSGTAGTTGRPADQRVLQGRPQGLKH